MTLSTLRCKYPLCPEPLKIDKVVFGYKTADGMDQLEVDQMIVLNCTKSCKTIKMSFFHATI
jgi:hypothetical protein